MVRGLGEEEGAVPLDEEALIRGVWRLALAYRGCEPASFYVEDEVGVAFAWGSTPANFASVPLVTKDGGFTVLWPTETVHRGDVVRRDALFGLPAKRKAALEAAFDALAPLGRRKPSSCAPLDRWRQALDARRPLVGEEKAPQSLAPRSASPDDPTAGAPVPAPEVVRVSTDLAWVLTELTDPRFVVVEGDPTSVEADFALVSRPGPILRAPLRSFFDYEACLVRKDHLAALCLRAGLSSEGSSHQITPQTFDLDSEVDAMMAAMHAANEGAQTDAKEGSNLWILKPARLARSIGHAVTSDSACAVAYAQAGFYVGQRYLARPWLFEGRKVDLRFVALLRSAHEPLELYVHDVFFVRAANKAHATTPAAVEDVEVALTAMHLLDRHPNHPTAADFIERVNANGAEEEKYKWPATLGRIHVAIRDIFAAAARHHDGFAKCKTGRAMYGCDFMLTHDLQPRLLEVTVSPAYLAKSPNMPTEYPNFANECVACLYFGDSEHHITRLA